MNLNAPSRLSTLRAVRGSDGVGEQSRARRRSETFVSSASNQRATVAWQTTPCDHTSFINGTAHERPGRGSGASVVKQVSAHRVTATAPTLAPPAFARKEANGSKCKMLLSLFAVAPRKILGRDYYRRRVLVRAFLVDPET